MRENETRRKENIRDTGTPPRPNWGLFRSSGKLLPFASASASFFGAMGMQPWNIARVAGSPIQRGCTCRPSMTHTVFCLLAERH